VAPTSGGIRIEDARQEIRELIYVLPWETLGMGAFIHSAANHVKQKLGSLLEGMIGPLVVEGYKRRLNLLTIAFD
jgi:hypothetical protein